MKKNYEKIKYLMKIAFVAGCNEQNSNNVLAKFNIFIGNEFNGVTLEDFLDSEFENQDPEKYVYPEFKDKKSGNMNMNDISHIQEFVDNRLNKIIKTSAVQNSQILEMLFRYIDTEIRLNESTRNPLGKNKTDHLMEKSEALKKSLRTIVGSGIVENKVEPVVLRGWTGGVKVEITEENEFYTFSKGGDFPANDDGIASSEIHADYGKDHHLGAIEITVYQGDDFDKIKAGIKASRLRDYILEKLNAPDESWQPIETAPKDGSYIWLGNENSIRIGFWASGIQYECRGTVGGGWRDLILHDTGNPCDLPFKPTHWKPVPNTPE